MPYGDMWQRFTNPAKRVIHFALEEAKREGMSVVGSEHILLGLVREGEGVAARVLERLGVSLARVRAELARRQGTREDRTGGAARLTLSPNAKKALGYALQEARELNPKLGLLDFVDTEHLLLGLIREGSGSSIRAVHLLEDLGVDPERVRKEIMNYLGGAPSISSSPSSPPSSSVVIKRQVSVAQLSTICSVAGRRVLYSAQEMANSAASPAIHTMHLLSAILREKDCHLVRLLAEQYQLCVENIVPAPDQTGAAATAIAGSTFIFSDNARHAIAQAVEYANIAVRMTGFIDGRLDIEHVFLGLLDTPAGEASQTLQALQLPLAEVRKSIIRGMTDAFLDEDSYNQTQVEVVFNREISLAALTRVSHELQDILAVNPYERDYDKGFELRERQRELKEQVEDFDSVLKNPREKPPFYLLTADGPSAADVHLPASSPDQHLVTGECWERVYRWAVAHEYVFAHRGETADAQHPVCAISWYDAVLWSNAHSEMDGIIPVYYLDQAYTLPLRQIDPEAQIQPVLRCDADGYRLPYELEWEQAARERADGADSSTRREAPEPELFYDEWLADRWYSLYSRADSTMAAGVAASGDTLRRVIRGNMHGGNPVAPRSASIPDNTYEFVGFRQVKSGCAQR